MPTLFEIASSVRVGIVAWVVSCLASRFEGDVAAASGIVSCLLLVLGLLLRSLTLMSDDEADQFPNESGGCPMR